VRSGRLTAAGAGAVLAALTVAAMPTTPAQAQDSAGGLNFAGTATALGVRLTLQSTGLPGTDTPIDGGGPTAIAVANSIGGGQGYASFPDPGQFILSLPGLGAGLFSSGAAGLPPVPVPFAPPAYPLAVVSTRDTGPQSAGDSAPYGIAADARSDSTTAKAVTGLSTGAGGSAGTVTSLSRVGPTDDGGVLASGESTTAGFAVGPLFIGELHSVATQKLTASGQILPSSELAISGMRIGGVPVGLAPDALNFAGSSVPFPMNESLAQVLAASGMKVELLKGEQIAGSNSVLSPALRVTIPFDSPAVQGAGQYTGTIVMTFGETSARMAGSGGSPGFGASPAQPGLDAATGSPAAAELAGLLPSTITPGAVPGTVAPVANAPTSFASDAILAGVGRQLGLETLYLLILAAALATGGFGYVIQRSGLRAWIASRS
jgi:hypothetical protein